METNCHPQRLLEDVATIVNWEQDEFRLNNDGVPSKCNGGQWVGFVAPPNVRLYSSEGSSLHLCSSVHDDKNAGYITQPNLKTKSLGKLRH